MRKESGDRASSNSTRNSRIGSGCVAQSKAVSRMFLARAGFMGGVQVVSV